MSDLASKATQGVPRSLTREQVEEGVRRFTTSYPLTTPEEATARAGLFAEDGWFEDPVGTPRLVGREALTQFFSAPLASGLVIRMEPQRMIVCGDEAISFTRVQWGMPGEQPTTVNVVHDFAFNPAGEITYARVFFDETCVE